MRTETINHTYVKFNELSDDQKQKVIEDNRDFNADYDWWEHVFEDATQVASLMGIDIERIYFSGFHSQGDGACFVGNFAFVKNITKNVKDYISNDEELHNIALDIQNLHRKSFYSAYGKVYHYGHYNHERSMTVDLTSEKGAYDDGEWLDVFADFASWIYKQLENEYNYLSSEEAIVESLEANEMEWEIVDGELIL